MSSSLLPPYRSSVVSMSASRPAVRSRRRNLVELYWRAYWKSYSLAMSWVLAVWVLLRVLAIR